MTILHQTHNVFQRATQDRETDPFISMNGPGEPGNCQPNRNPTGIDRILQHSAELLAHYKVIGLRHGSVLYKEGEIFHVTKIGSGGLLEVASQKGKDKETVWQERTILSGEVKLRNGTSICPSTLIRTVSVEELSNGAIFRRLFSSDDPMLASIDQEHGWSLGRGKERTLDEMFDEYEFYQARFRDKIAVIGIGTPPKGSQALLRLESDPYRIVRVTFPRREFLYDSEFHILIAAKGDKTAIALDPLTGTAGHGQSFSGFGRHRGMVVGLIGSSHERDTPIPLSFPNWGGDVPKLYPFFSKRYKGTDISITDVQNSSAD